MYSLCEANPETLVLVLVDSPRARFDAELLAAGAFAVLDDSRGWAGDLLQAAAAADRLLAMQEKQRLMSANLAHRDKIAAIGILAAGVSHEVNNPCAAILSNVSSLREDLEDLMRRPKAQRLQALDAFAAEAVAALSDCVGASHRIADIVNTLNLFSRKDDSFEEVSLNVNREVETVLRLLGKEVKCQADFEVNLEPDLPPVLGPRNSVAQIVTNLVVNALHATSSVAKERRRVWIRTLCDDDFVVLEVGDNGPGISPELAQRVFDPFYTTKPVGEGTGLGLAITRQLVQQMNGEILLQSAPGEGATFSVFFERRAVLPVETITAPSGAPLTDDRLRLLVVDDDPFFPVALARAIGKQFELHRAHSAAEARERLKRDDAFDAVLVDVIMPDTDGVVFFTWLSQEHPALRTRVVFMTGGITSRALTEALDATGRPCLSKPVDHHELVTMIRMVARGGASTGEVASAPARARTMG